MYQQHMAYHHMPLKQTKAHQYYSPYFYQPSRMIPSVRLHPLSIEATKIRTAGAGLFQQQQRRQQQQQQSMIPMCYYYYPLVPTPMPMNRKGGSFVFAVVKNRHNNPINKPRKKMNSVPRYRHGNTKNTKHKSFMVRAPFLVSSSRKGGNCACNSMTFDLKDDSDEEES
jgi:hypothetical protein